VPASFRQGSGELLETKVSVWLQVFCLVFQTVQFSVFLVKKKKRKCVEKLRNAWLFMCMT
jgi:hypothetical protein